MDPISFGSPNPDSHRDKAISGCALKPMQIHNANIFFMALPLRNTLSSAMYGTLTSTPMTPVFSGDFFPGIKVIDMVPKGKWLLCFAQA
jgi:hypothetical protein